MAVVVLFAIGLAWAAVAVWVGYSGDLSGDPRAKLMDVLPWLLYQWVGLLLLSRRRGAREGTLLYLVGVTLPLPMFLQGSEPIVFWSSLLLIGAGFWGISRVLIQHVVLAFPTGHVSGRAERLFLTVSYLTLILTQALVIATADTGSYLPGLPANPFLLHSDEGLYFWLSDLHAGAGAFLVAVFVILLLRRWRNATAPMRRVIGPVFLAAVAAASLFAVSVVLLFAGSGRSWIWPLRNQVFGLEAFFTTLIPFAVLVGIARSRLDRADVADMLGRLERGGNGDELRTVLAQAVGDPEMVIAQETETGELVDLVGQAVPRPGPSEGRRATAIDGSQSPRLWLVHDAALSENTELLRAAGAAARLTLENERLQATVREQLAEVRVSRARIVAASDAERRRIERDLHDGAQQRLVTVALQLELLRERGTGLPVEFGGLLEATAAELEAALAELRELARGIHPAVLTQSGLRPAIESMTLRSPLVVDIDVPDVRLPAAIEAAAYFVVTEGLTNAARYSGADEARVRIAHMEGTLDLIVSDDGCGGADPAMGSGLRGLVDRLSALGGSLEIDSPPGSGTRLHAVIPCA
jgi:signal transduction histidine kinase